MSNLIIHWERKAKRAMRRNHHIGYEAAYYTKALSYCDCIREFTDDENRFDCFDRLQQEMFAEIEASKQ